MSENPPETTTSGESKGAEPVPDTPAPTQAPPGEGPKTTPEPATGVPAAEPGATAPSAAAAETASAGGEARPKRKKRRRRKKRLPGQEREGAPPPPATRHRSPRPRNQPAIVAVRALSEMAEALLRVEGVDFLAMPRYMDIRVRVPMDAHRDGKTAAASVVEQILERVREVREHEKALVPGSVYCYFNQSAQAETSKPKAPREVFDGYSSTGRPIFSDFVTMSIERKDPGIDALLAGEDVVLTNVTMGRVLRTQQLQEFGQESQVFKILGQVDAGLFRVLGAEQKAAYSFQLLRGTTLEGKPRLRLHPVGAVPVMDLADPNIAQILSRFQRKLDAESLRLAGKESNGEVDEEEFVLPLLQDLARQLSGRARRQVRRTQHAVQRSDEQQRPTTKAFADADGADDSHLLWDMEKGTVVVLGPRGRVHVFTPAARHVTSLMMQGSEIQKRRQQGRWRAAEPEERGEFRIQLRMLLQSGEAKTAPEAALQGSVEPEPEPAPAPAPAPAVPVAPPVPEQAPPAPEKPVEVPAPETAADEKPAEGASEETPASEAAPPEPPAEQKASEE